MLTLFENQVSATTLLSLFVLKPALASLLGLWLLDQVRYQSAKLRKYVTRAIFLSLVLIPIIGLTLPHLEVPLIPGYAFWNDLKENYLLFSNITIKLLGNIYLIGLFYLIVRLIRDISAVVTLSRKSPVLEHNAQPHWMQERLTGCRFKPRIRICSIENSPVVWGLINPTILLPNQFFTLSRDIQEQMIDHELTHIQQHDWLLLILARLCCCVFWYIPWIWKLQRKLTEVIENACDDSVLEKGHAAHSYARTLVNAIKQERLKRITLSLSQKPFFIRRTEAILDKFTSRERPSQKLKIMISVVGVLSVFLLSITQATTFTIPTTNKENSLIPLVIIHSSRSMENPSPADTNPTINLHYLKTLTVEPTAQKNIKRESSPHDTPLASPDKQIEKIALSELPGSLEVTKPFFLRKMETIPLKTVLPIYPRKAFISNKEGEVTVSYDILQDGSVTNVHIIHATPKGYFEEAVINAIRQFKFKITSKKPENQRGKKFTSTFICKLSDSKNST